MGQRGYKNLNQHGKWIADAVARCMVRVFEPKQSGEILHHPSGRIFGHAEPQSVGKLPSFDSSWSLVAHRRICFDVWLSVLSQLRRIGG